MILTVTLNPTLDRAVTVDGFEIGGLLKIRESNYYPGGKGVNVARVLKLLGADVGVIMFEGGPYGEHMRRAITEEGIGFSSVKLKGDTRSNITIIDAKSNKETHMLEAGPNVSSGEVSGLFSLFREELKKSKFVILSGSIPVGAPEDIYAKCILEAEGDGVDCALDTRGEPLKIGLGARPYLVKPNRRELGEVYGENLESVEDVIDRGRRLVESGISMVLVSLGKDGMILITKSEIWEAKPPRIHAVNSVGSGDALLAGFIFSHLRGEKIENAISTGMACGTANCLSPTVGTFKVSDVEDLRKQIRVTRL